MPKKEAASDQARDPDDTDDDDTGVVVAQPAGGASGTSSDRKRKAEFPALELLGKKIKAVLRGKGQITINPSTQAAMGAAGGAVLTNTSGASTALQHCGNDAARSVVTAARTQGPVVMNGIASGIGSGLWAMLGAAAAFGANNSAYGPRQITSGAAAGVSVAAGSRAAPAVAAPAVAAAVDGGFGFGRVHQAAPPDPPATPLDQTFAGLFEIAAKNPAMFIPSHKIESCTDGEPTMADPIIQNGGIAWDICQRIPNMDKCGLVVWVATNARKNGTIQGVWVQDAGKTKCPYGPNCAAHANGECQNSHAGCWAHGAPGFDGLPSNGSTCGKQGVFAKVPGHAQCHKQNQHTKACTHNTPLGPCPGHKWTPGEDDRAGILPQYCQPHLVDWVVEQIRNSTLEEQYQTQSFPEPTDKEPWGPSNSAYMHLKTKCGDAGQKLVRNAITKAYGNKKTSRELLEAWDAPLADEDY